MKLSVMLMLIPSVLMVAELSFAKTCDSITSTNPTNELKPDQLKGDGEWRMQSMQFHMKIEFEAEKNSAETHPNPIYEQLKGLIDDFGGTATTKTDLSALTSKPLAEIKQGFNAQDFVTLDCISGVSNTEEKSDKGVSTTTTLESVDIHGNMTLPYSIDRSSLGVNLVTFTSLDSKNEEFPTNSVLKVPEKQFSLQDLYDEMEKTPFSPDRMIRFWMEAITDEQIKIVITYAGRETKTMNFNRNESQAINGSIVRQSNDKIPVDGTLIISAQAVGIYSLQK